MNIRKTKKLTTIGMLCALAYIAAVVCVIVIPLAALAAGFVIWFRRRRR